VEPAAVSLINAKGFLLDDIKRQSLHLILLTVAILLLSRWGVVGIAFAVTFAAFANWILLSNLLSRRIGFSARQYVESVLPAVLSCIVMTMTTTILQSLMREHYGVEGGWLLLISIVWGGVIYYATLLCLDRYVKWPLFNDSFAEIQSVIGDASQPLISALGIRIKRQS